MWACLLSVSVFYSVCLCGVVSSQVLMTSNVLAVHRESDEQNLQTWQHKVSSVHWWELKGQCLYFWSTLSNTEPQSSEGILIQRWQHNYRALRILQVFIAVCDSWAFQTTQIYSSFLQQLVKSWCLTVTFCKNNQVTVSWCCTSREI